MLITKLLKHKTFSTAVHTEMEQQGSKNLEHQKQQLSNIRHEDYRVKENRDKGKLGSDGNSKNNCKKAVTTNQRQLYIAKKFCDESSKRDTYGTLTSKPDRLEHFQQKTNNVDKDCSIAKKGSNRVREGQATKYQEQDLSIAKEVGDRAGEGRAYCNLGDAYGGLGAFKQAIKYQEQDLSIAKEVGDRAGEGGAYANLGNAYTDLGDFKQAIKYHEQDLSIAKEMGDREGEGCAYGNLGNAYRGLGDFKQARKYHEQHLSIAKEVGDRAGEGCAYGNLGNAYHGLGDFKQAIKYHEQDLSIAKEVGDRAGEGCAYGNLGNAYRGLGDFKQAIKYHEQDLSIAKEVGDRAAEGGAYANLGNAYHGLGDFKQAIKYHEQHLSIAKEVGDRAGEGCAYGNLGNAYTGLGDFKQARKYHEQHLSIAKEVGDRAGEGCAYGNLGNAYRGLGDFKQAIKYHEQDLSIAKEVGDRAGEGSASGNLGNAYKGLGDFKQAIIYHEQHLSIAKEVGDRAGEGNAHLNLGYCFHDLSNFRRAVEFHKQHLSIVQELGDRSGQQAAYLFFGNIQHSLGDLRRSIEYCLRSLKIAEEIGDSSGKGKAYCCLGRNYLRLRDFKLGRKYLKLHLHASKEIGDACGEGCAYTHLGRSCEMSGCLMEALDCYQCSVNIFNGIRQLLEFEDTWKVSFRDLHQEVYTSLFRVLLKLSMPDEALSAAEQGRAQALMDLMASNYGLELLLPLSLEHKEMISDIARDTSSQIVFVALEGTTINLWVLSKGKDVHFRQNDIQDRDALSFVMTLTQAAFKEYKCGRSLGLQRGDLQPTKASRQTEQSCCQNNSLQVLYRSIFSPIIKFLKRDELIIVPDGPLGLVPFAAFVDEASRYLSESFRIRMIPSLTSLRLLADCPEDYHSKTGALLVGDPCLQEITNVFGKPKIRQLPYAKKEVEMIGEILNTTPLTEKEATKNEVLKRIGSAALIHIAAHGKMGSGEIFLAPNRERKYADPEEKDYIMKMADVHAVQLRARLVVLSCCHSGEGEIKAEGVVGIARAFLGAGARSVLVSLWAIDDEATMEFMKSFYQHMRNGNSASMSLNQAMKCLRKSSKFNEVKFWAPFVLIGDDVTLDFGGKEQEHCR